MSLFENALEASLRARRGASATESLFQCSTCVESLQIHRLSVVIKSYHRIRGNPSKAKISFKSNKLLVVERKWSVFSFSFELKCCADEYLLNSWFKCRAGRDPSHRLLLLLQDKAKDGEVLASAELEEAPPLVTAPFIWCLIWAWGRLKAFFLLW